MHLALLASLSLILTVCLEHNGSESGRSGNAVPKVGGRQR